MLDLLGLLPSTPGDWAIAAAVVVPWLAGVALILACVCGGVAAVVRGAWRMLRRAAAEAADPTPEQEHDLGVPQ